MSKKIDLVTIVFNDEIELKLLKLQAYSLKYIAPSFINNIFIVYNDDEEHNFEDILEYYPDELKFKVTIIYRKDLCPDIKGSNWHNQQLLKLVVAQKVISEYYVVLDSKNHLIRDVSEADFFNSDGKSKLFTFNPGWIIKHYFSCLQYFEAKNIFNYQYEDVNKTRGKGYNILLSDTPYIFKTADVLEMIEYIKKKEGTSFETFFLKRNDITEFYLYATYLIWSEKIENYSLEKHIKSTIFENPYLVWNTYSYKKNVITDSSYKFFGLHRLAVKTMNSEYKNNLLELYSKFYSAKMVEFIKKDIFNIIT